MKRSALVILLGGILIVIGVLSFQRMFLAESRTFVPTPSPSPVMHFEGSDDVTITTAKFYQEYDACIKQPQEQESNSLSCISSNSYASLRLRESINVQEVDTQKDAILCSEAPPSGYQISNAIKDKDGVKVSVQTEGDGKSQKIQVRLIQEEKKWKVTDTECIPS